MVNEDSHMQDQLVVLRALEAVRRQQQQQQQQRNEHESPTTQPTLTLHTQTARWVCEEMLGVKFDAGGWASAGFRD